MAPYSIRLHEQGHAKLNTIRSCKVPHNVPQRRVNLTRYDVRAAAKHCDLQSLTVNSQCVNRPIAFSYILEADVLQVCSIICEWHVAKKEKRC